MTGFELFLLAAFLISAAFNLVFLMVAFASPHPSAFRGHFISFWGAVDRYAILQEAMWDEEKETDE